MKHLLRIASLLIISLAFTACSDDDDEQQPQYLPVTTANLNGTWRMAEWNGTQDTDNWYFYITFDRSDETFVSYERMNSMKGEKRTGKFYLEQDEYTGTYTLSGTYDYGKGDWTHEYEVTQMTDKTMTLTATEDKNDVQKYVRVDEVPTDIQKGTRAIVH